MKAYKVWYDTKHFIHKDTTDQLNVTWTENITDAKEVSGLTEAIKFFYGLLGFNQFSKYDALRLL